MRLSSGRSFPPSWWGPALLLSLGALPVRSSGLSGALVGLPGSLLCLLPGYRSSSSQFPVVWLVLLLPSLQPYTRPLYGLLAVPPFLLSGLFAVCFPRLWASLFPCRLPRPGLLSPVSRHLQLPPLRGTRCGVWILHFCSSCVLPPTLSHGLSLVCFLLLSLTACLLFLFLGTAFPGTRYVPRFYLLFFWPWFQSVSVLFRSGVASGLLVLSAAGVPGSLFPLRCFAFNHVVSVPFCSQISLDWMVRPPSSSVVFRRLLLFIGFLWVGRPVLFLFSVSLFLVCSWGLCSSSFPPPRLWSSRLAFRSVTVPLVFSCFW